jgi:hypothetical protein
LGETNVQTARKKLAAAGFSAAYCNDFVIVLWNLGNNYYGTPKTKFETNALARNTFYYSGFNGATIEFLTNKILTPGELFQAAMDQEVLNMVEI